jgi:capsular polysaccharide transport system permease protein
MLETKLRNEVPHPPEAQKAETSSIPVLVRNKLKPQRLPSGPALVLVFVLLALASYATYLFAYASKLYAVEVRFAVRIADLVRPQQGPSLFGGAMIATLTESNAVVQYLRSRDALDSIDTQMPVQQLFARPDIDIFQRLRANAPPERALQYMNRMVIPHFDHTSGIVTVEVRAFSPEEARSLAVLVENLAEALVNRMSSLARQGLLTAVERETAEAEARLAALRDELRDLRERSERLDPRRNALAADELRAKLETEIAMQRARLEEQRRFIRDSAPQIVQQRDRLEALQRELREQVLSGTASSEQSLPATLRQFEALEFAVMNAQKAYDAALATLERARGDANRQQIYLSPIVRPSLPLQEAYPRPWHELLTFGALGSLAGLLMLLLMRTLREHVA